MVTETIILKQTQRLASVVPKLAKLPAGLDAAAFGALVQDVEQARAEVARLEREGVAASNRKAEKLEALYEMVKNMRKAVGALYGDDSTEYELVGGTRRSERKRPHRGAVQEPAKPPAP